jgi:ribonuclease-3
MGYESNLKVISKEEYEKMEKNIYPIYNENNTYVSKQNIQNMLKRGGIEEEISDLTLWQKAFVHNSYCENNEELYKNEKFYGILNEEDIINNPEIIPLQPESSESFEWLGDGILQAVMAHYLYNRYYDQQEGFLTKLRSKLVKTETLSKLALHLRFDKFIMVSKHIEIVCNARKNNTILEDAFEGFIGSMMCDFGKNDKAHGFDMCYKFIVTLMEKYIDITQYIIHDDNYKQQLMIYFQKNFDGKLPVYKDVETLNVKNEQGIVTRRFKVNVYDINGKLIGSGTQKSKRDAQQQAAKAALNKYGISGNFI